jgi:hypothetical protein
MPVIRALDKRRKMDARLRDFVCESRLRNVTDSVTILFWGFTLEGAKRI